MIMKTMPVLLAASAALSAGAARAQDAPPVLPAQTAQTAQTAQVTGPVVKPVPALRLEAVAARLAAAQITQATGATVLTDSTVALVPVTLSTVGGDLTSVLKQMVGVLPKGVVVRTLMLPAFSPKAAMPSGDDLIALYTAQEHLVTPVMGAKAAQNAPADDINVLGKLLSEEKAAPLIAALDLRPVYVLTNAQAGDNLVAQASKLQVEGLRLWMAMSPEQRVQAAEQQFDSLMNMDSATRQAMLGQAMQSAQAIGSKMASMPAAQREAFMNDLKNSMPAAPVPGAGPAKP